MMNAVFTDLFDKIPGQAAGKGKSLQIGSFADFLKKGMERDAGADSNILGANTVVKKKISTVEKGSAAHNAQKKDTDKDVNSSVAAIMQEFMTKLQDIAQKVERGPGEWTLTPGNKDLLRKLGRSAGMKQPDLEKLMNRLEQKQDGMLVPDFLGALAQNFADQQKEHAVQIPETDLPLLETFLARMGIQVEKIAASSNNAVTGDSKLDLNLYLAGLNTLEGGDAITLSAWEGEQLQDLLRQAGASEQLVKQLLPEKNAAAASQLFNAADVRHLAAVAPGADDGGEIELTLDRLKSMLAKAIEANDASQPRTDVPSFLVNLETVLEQAGFQERSVGWSPVVQESIVMVYQELQQMVDASLERDNAGDNRKLLQDMFRSAAAMKENEAGVFGRDVADKIVHRENRQVLPPGKIYRSDFAFGKERVAEQTAAAASAGKTSPAPPAGLNNNILMPTSTAETTLSVRTALARLANLTHATEVLSPQSGAESIKVDPAILEKLTTTNKTNKTNPTNKTTPTNPLPLGAAEFKQLAATIKGETGVDPIKLLAKLSGREHAGPVALNAKEVKFLQDVLSRAGINKNEWQPLIAGQNLPGHDPVAQLENILSRLGMGPEEIKQLSAQLRANQPVDLEKILTRLQEGEDQLQPLALTETETELLQDVFKQAQNFSRQRQPQLSRDTATVEKFDDHLAKMQGMAKAAIKESDAGRQSGKLEAILQELSGFPAPSENEGSAVVAGWAGSAADLLEEIAAIRQVLGKAVQPPANRGKNEARVSLDNGLPASSEIDEVPVPAAPRPGSTAAADLQLTRQAVMPGTTAAQAANAAAQLSAHGKGVGSDFASRQEAAADKVEAQKMANSLETPLTGKDTPGETALEKRPLPTAIFSESHSNTQGKNDLPGFFPEERRGVEQAATLANRPAPPPARPGAEWQQQAFHQLSQGVARSLQNKEHHLVLKLYPEDLGQVDIKLSVKNGHVSINFGMENGQVKEILENNMGQFRDNLSKHGFVLDGCQVSVGNQEQNKEKYEQSEFVASSPRRKGRLEAVTDHPEELLYRTQVDRYGRDQNISVIA